MGCNNHRILLTLLPLQQGAQIEPERKTQLATLYFIGDFEDIYHRKIKQSCSSTYFKVVESNPFFCLDKVFMRV